MTRPFVAPGRVAQPDVVRVSRFTDAAQDLRRLKQIERMLEEAGLVRRRQGRLEVTPRGARKLGERALTRIFEALQRDREGSHEARDPGGLAEPTGATRPWEFGNHGQLAVQRTVFNAELLVNWMLLPIVLLAGVAVSLLGVWGPLKIAMKCEPAVVLRGE